METYNRYKEFTMNGTIKLVPFIPIPVKDSDYYILYKKGETRLDIISYRYYNDPNYDWLIMQANPEHGFYEFLIPDNTLIRIPYPLEPTIAKYKSDIKKYKEMEGIDEGTK